MTALDTAPDVLVVGSGMGGASLAAGLAGSGARVLILERGRRLEPGPAARDPVAIFRDGRFRAGERWIGPDGHAFDPGVYAMVGGATKMYGAVLIRYRARDFEAVEHFGGVSPAWPFGYDELEPWYTAAERLYRVRGAAEQDPTEPPRSAPLPHPPVPDEPAIAAARARLTAAGRRPFSLPLGVDIGAWLADGATPWDAFPNAGAGKMDAETCGLAAALADPRITLATEAEALRLEPAPDGRRIVAVHARVGGETVRFTPGVVALAAGAARSAALLLASSCATGGDHVGRCFMSHNSAALLAIDPRRRNDAIYQKTLGVNDFYWGDPDASDRRPLGNIQLLGKISGDILSANLPRVPRLVCDAVATRSVDWYLMAEDLPHRDSRIRLDGGRIRLDWRRSNLEALERLERRATRMLKEAGWPIVLRRRFDRRTPSHQCGTVRMAADPAEGALDPASRTFDHPNLYVVDASALPTSAAVNPALTVAALALRAADHIRKARA